MTLNRLSELFLLVLVALFGCGGGGGSASTSSTSSAAAGEPAVLAQEAQCINNGWNRTVILHEGRNRVVLWKGPNLSKGPWAKGAVFVLHGGGGQNYHFCVANAALTVPQVAFAEAAVADGFGVILVNSTDQVADLRGRICGKVWDDEVRPRPNLDLSFFEALIDSHLVQWRPAGSRTEVFVTGLSSGGYMSTRLATRFNTKIKAFAPVSSGDPYGWTRNCDPSLSNRTDGVFGASFDNETGKQIFEINACAAPSYPKEAAWDGVATSVRPRFMMVHHENDGIHDASCVLKASSQLRSFGYPEAPELLLRGGVRAEQYHYWLPEYNRPILDFFSTQLN